MAEWNMAEWQIVAQADSIENFQYAVPSVDDLPAGTPVNLHIQLPQWAPVGGLANLFMAEWVAQRFIDEAHVRITDVRSDDAYSVTIDGEVTGTPVHLILFGVGAILLAVLGIAIVYAISITLQAYMTIKREETRLKAWNDTYTAELARGLTPAEAAAIANKQLESITPPEKESEKTNWGLIALGAAAIVVGGMIISKKL